MGEPILVVVFLRGGADGLGLVCPASDTNLIAARPEDLRVLRHGDGAGRRIAQEVADQDFRFHASLGPLADLYDAGDLSLIHASGLTEATRSHFDAEARMERGLLGAMPPGDPSGWIGRWLTAVNPGGPMPALAVGTQQPTSLLGSAAAVSESLGDLMVAGGHWLAPALRARLAAGFGQGPLAAPMAGLLHLSEMIGQRLWSEADQALLTYTPKTPYPENPLSPSLMTVAQAIKQDLGLRVATVDFGSWDTHVAQSGAFAEMAGWLAGSVMAFWRDLGPLQQEVSVVVMSEFGRRLRSNTAGGTDHGRGNVMFVLGPQARGGRMVGRWPGLAHGALEEGADLAVVTDYRSVLAEVLTGQMGLADLESVFPGFKTAPLGLWG
jgi:uncharacterized protein (DUF1501 family)